MFTLLIVGSLWISLALGLPAYIESLRRDAKEAKPRLWALFASAAIVFGVDSYYRHYVVRQSPYAQARVVLEEMTDLWSAGDHNAAVRKLSEAASMRPWEDGGR